MTTALASKPDYLKAVGLITAEWNAVEHSMMWILSLLTGCGMEKGEAIFYAIESNRGRREMVIAVAQIALRAHPEQLSKLGSLLDRTRKAAKRRNTFAHALWGVAMDGSVTHGNNLSNRQPVSLHELEQVAEQLRALQTDFVAFITSLFGPQPSPQKP